MNTELLALIHKMRGIFENKVIGEQIYNEDIKNEENKFSYSQRNECHYCKSHNINKNGRARNSVQRYICRECGKTFSDVTGLPLSYTKKPMDKWIKYTMCIKSGASLRKTAEILDINLTTSFHWRHKILSVIGTQIMQDKLSDNIEIDEIKIKESFKGRRRIEKITSFIGTENSENNQEDKRGRITILNCRDSLDRKFMKPVTKGSIRREVLDKYLKPIISDGEKCLAPPKNFTYYFFIRENGLKLSVNGDKPKYFKKIKTVKTGITNDLVNQRGRAFKLFLKKFHNVASKYLSFYINWFVVFIVEDNLSFSLFRKVALGKKQLRAEDFNKVNFKGEILRNKRPDEIVMLKVS